MIESFVQLVRLFYFLRDAIVNGGIIQSEAWSKLREAFKIVLACIGVCVGMQHNGLGAACAVSQLRLTS